MEKLPFTGIQTLDQVRDFFTHLSTTEKLIYHPDDDFRDYTAPGNVYLYTEEQAQERNLVMNECFACCYLNGVDIYEIAMEVIKETTFNWVTDI